METMAVTMLTPRDAAVEASAPTAASLAASRWRRSALQMMTRRNLLPWLAIKSVLTALVFSGQMTVWTAFVLDTVVSVAVIAYGWRFARRQAGRGRDLRSLNLLQEPGAARGSAGCEAARSNRARALVTPGTPQPGGSHEEHPVRRHGRRGARAGNLRVRRAAGARGRQRARAAELRAEPRQTSAKVRFLSRGAGYTLLLTGGGRGGRSARRPGRDDEPGGAGHREPRRPSPCVSWGRTAGLGWKACRSCSGKVHYLRGARSKRWQVNVPTYGKVAYREADPGIDVVFYGNQRQLEYDFVVAAGADPRVIRLAFDGATTIRVAESGGSHPRQRRGEISAAAADRLSRPRHEAHPRARAVRPRRPG